MEVGWSIGWVFRCKVYGGIDGRREWVIKWKGGAGLVKGRKGKREEGPKMNPASRKIYKVGGTA